MAKVHRSKQRPSAAKDPITISDPELATFRQLIASLKTTNIEGYHAARTNINRLLDLEPTDKVSIPDNGQFLLSVNLSNKVLPGYATLDDEHVARISTVLVDIKKYVREKSQKRPHNLLMIAAPGAGKSHFINCLATVLKDLDVRPIIFNMTALERYEDLTPAIDRVRNLKVEDKLPLLFLDEFDSNQNNIPLLLPLLWDGELSVGQRDLKLGRVVIILAGSNPALPQIMDQARSMRHGLALNSDINPKIVDLLSRINGGSVEIPPFEQAVRKIERSADKACIAVQLLRRRFGRSLRTVPLGLLQFIVQTDFRYGVRSIDQLVEQIPHKDDVIHLSREHLALPAMRGIKALKESPLAYHVLHYEDPHSIVKAWTTAIKATQRVLISASYRKDLPTFLEPMPSHDTVKTFLEVVRDAITSEELEPPEGILARYGA